MVLFFDPEKIGHAQKVASSLPMAKIASMTVPITNNNLGCVRPQSIFCFLPKFSYFQLVVSVNA